MASPTPTLPPKTPEEQDQRYNPYEQNYQEKMGSGYVSSGLDQLESFANDPKNSTEAARQAEEAADAPISGGLYNPTSGGKSKVKGKGFFRRRGAALGIGGALGGGLLGLTVFFTPALGIVQLKETMLNDLNDQLAAVDIRSNAMWRAKLGDISTGVCTNNVRIRCQFQTMSPRQIEKFRTAGFTIEDGNLREGLFGRQRITQMTAPNGSVISDPQDLINLRNDPSVRASLNRVFNPLYASLSDRVANNVFTERFKTSKATKVTGTTPEELDDSMRAATAGEDANGARGTLLTEPDGDQYLLNEDGQPVYEGEPGFDELLADAEEAGGDFDEKVAQAAEGTKAVGSVLGGAIKGVSVLGAADSACTVYNTARAVAAAAKATRSIQLAQYAMVFLTTADEIKAGTATPEQVEYLGNILTATDTRQYITDELSTTTGTTVDQAVDNAQERENPFYGKNAFDSPGYAVAAYNDAPVLTTRSQQYMIGGGLTGTLSSVTDDIASSLGGRENINSSCGVIQSWWVRGAGLVAGVVAAIGSFGTSTVISIGASLAVSIALPFLEAALADIVAGQVVGPSTKGVDSGDAIFSGSSALLGGVAQARGLKPASEAELEPYLTQTESVQSDYIAQARYEAKATPFDIMNEYSFLGSLARTINVPLSQAGSGATGALAFIPRLLGASITAISPTASAQQSSYNPDRFNRCEDQGYDDLGIKADVFCNVRYVLTEEDQGRDPMVVLDFMLNNDHITDTGTASSDQYKNYLQYCVNREDGWGETGEEQQDDWKTGKACMGTSEVVDAVTLSNFRVYTIDKSISDAMDDEEQESAGPIGGLEGLVAPAGDGFTITSGFGPRVAPCGNCSNYHQGIDIVGGGGVVRAIMDGTVIDANKAGWNNIVKIKHADGLISTYWHMYANDILVNTGDTVTAGQQLGVMGNSGDSVGTHLHIELDISEVEDRAYYESTYIVGTGGWNVGQRIDPQDFFQKNGVAGF